MRWPPAAVRRLVPMMVVVAGLLAGCARPLTSAPPTSAPPTPARTTSAACATPVSRVCPAATAPGTAGPAPAPPASPVPRNLLAAAGAMVVGRVQPGPLGWWVLELVVVLPDTSRTPGSFNFRVPDGWEPRWNNGGLIGSIRVTADGWAAIEIRRIVEQGMNDNAVLVVDLLGRRGATDPIIGSGPVWLPDGTLLVTAMVRVGGTYRETARRIGDHGFGETLDLVIDQELARPYFPLRYIVHGDESGLEGWGGDVGWTGDVYRWDGGVLGRDPIEPPYLELGNERSSGANGERILNCPPMEESCPLRWRRADGKVLKHPVEPMRIAWTRDGTALVILVLDGGRE